jgi:predicted nucleic acid-binding protein
VATASHPPGLTDTDILIDAARGASDAIAFLSAQRTASAIAISVISAMELVVGCQDAADLLKVRQFLSGVRMLPVTSQASLSAQRLVETYYLSHGLLIPDALIAATALDQSLASVHAECPPFSNDLIAQSDSPILTMTRVESRLPVDQPPVLGFRADRSVEGTAVQVSTNGTHRAWNRLSRSRKPLTTRTMAMPSSTCM